MHDPFVEAWASTVANHHEHDTQPLTLTCFSCAIAELLRRLPESQLADKPGDPLLFESVIRHRLGVSMVEFAATLLPSAKLIENRVFPILVRAYTEGLADGCGGMQSPRGRRAMSDRDANDPRCASCGGLRFHRHGCPDPQQPRTGEPRVSEMNDDRDAKWVDAFEKHTTYRFRVDTAEHETTLATLTPLEIKALACVPANYHLAVQEADGPDRILRDDEAVDLTFARQFYAFPQGTYAG